LIAFGVVFDDAHLNAAVNRIPHDILATAHASPNSFAYADIDKAAGDDVRPCQKFPFFLKGRRRTTTSHLGRSFQVPEDDVADVAMPDRRSLRSRI
jgi:hypothetical protein